MELPLSKRERSGQNYQNKPHLLEPKTQNQQDYIRSIAENVLTICHGCAGSGKSYCAVGIGCQYLSSKKVDKIFITRSLVGCGKEIGAMPGGMDEKMSPYILPYIDYLEFFLGKISTQAYIDNKKIIVTPVELLRGYTLDNTFIIAEECQNMTHKQLKLLLTRIGQHSKLILIGDDKQSDINNGGFNFCIEKLKELSNIGVVSFDYGDICRNPIIAHILEVFDSYGI